ncbi:hypothetical protein H0H81_006830 [Sphagnurus paluster]|uniref:Uncharacterized protein n=1 Tax=Sphagnurus paluster TaxID=117069 RepID=A0A9P7KLU9_9AGAR|nr:hypothetical protein H0H81_006830 [Sphagnurus paluster]
MDRPGSGSPNVYSHVVVAESLPFTPRRRNFRPYRQAHSMSSASLPPPRSPVVVEHDADRESIDESPGRRITLWGSEEDLCATNKSGLGAKAAAWGHALHHTIAKVFKSAKQHCPICRRKRSSQFPVVTRLAS